LFFCYCTVDIVTMSPMSVCHLYVCVMYVVEQPANALEDAIYFLKALQQLAVDRIETHLLAYRIYMRKGKECSVMSI